MTRSFRSLFDEDSRLVIPIVQRDYAQGREGEVEVEVRTRFLRDLRTALEGDEPLHLDFVYGFVPHGDERPEHTGRAILPLDGQQRLTTLFLLHWYLAARDGAADDFRAMALQADGGRFTYEVRQTSTDFFDALTRASLDLDALLPADPEVRNALSKTLRDQRWFFLSWERDPTVRACLTMLDAIHECFADSRALYGRLNARVTFEFLELDNFGLGDELYIKMNARGKPLTAFETFKAQLEKHIDEELPGGDRHYGERELPRRDYVALRFDTRWCDLFWDPQSNEQFDAKMMNALRAIALVALPPAGKGEEMRKVTDTLERIYKAELKTFFDYEEAGLVSEAFVESLIRLMDAWAGDEGKLETVLRRADYYDEAAMFAKVLDGKVGGDGAVTYTDWVRFVAFCAYRLGRAEDDGLEEWMRLLTNLAKNTALENVDTFRTALVGAEELLAALDGFGGSLIDYVANPKQPIGGFLRQQIREERLKAQLILRDGRWRELIEEAETHGYFEGQIEFLLAFCGALDRWLPTQLCDWSPDEDAALRDSFALWLAKVTALFPRSGVGLRRDLPAGELLWERALLCEGDYLLRKGANVSLLSSVDRDVSWKRLLRADNDEPERLAKRDVVRRVLGRLAVDDVVGSLRAIVADGVQPAGDQSDGWRRRLVAAPEMMTYCRKRWLRHEEGRLLLLDGVRKATFKELFTWTLCKELERRLVRAELLPFDCVEMPAVWGSADPPHLLLGVNGRSELRHRIEFRSGMFSVSRAEVEGARVDATPEDIVDALLDVARALRDGKDQATFEIRGEDDSPTG